jgi:sigma-B regulation protein RsbU (phosphoserine phosphatase)
MFVTVFTGILDLQSGEFRYANGGHNPPLFASSSDPGFRFMKLKKGLPLGVIEDFEYTSCSMTVKEGDKFVLYTDGVNEAMNKDGEQWGNERFLQSANAHRNLKPEDFDKTLRSEIVSFCAGAEQSDDITTLDLTFLKKKNAATENRQIPGPGQQPESRR